MKKIILTAAMLGAMSLSATTASAFAPYLGDVNTALGTNFDPTGATGSECLVCHSAAGNSAGDKGVTPFAIDYKAGVAAFGAITAAEATALAGLNSDNANGTNADDAAAGIDFWGTVATTPAATDSGGGCITSSATTPLMMVLAMLAAGFFVRRKKS